MHKQDLCLAFWSPRPGSGVAAPNAVGLDRRRDPLYLLSVQLNLPLRYPPF